MSSVRRPCAGGISPRLERRGLAPTHIARRAGRNCLSASSSMPPVFRRAAPTRRLAPSSRPREGARAPAGHHSCCGPGGVAGPGLPCGGPPLGQAIPRLRPVEQIGEDHPRSSSGGAASWRGRLTLRTAARAGGANHHDRAGDPVAATDPAAEPDARRAAVSSGDRATTLARRDAHRGAPGGCRTVGQGAAHTWRPAVPAELMVASCAPASVRNASHQA
jgi:hypothetical protein